MSNDNISHLIQEAQALFQRTFNPSPSGNNTGNDNDKIPYHCTCAPGRVNLIGEHTDYTEGLVLPMCIGYSTICYGRGKVVQKDNDCKLEQGTCRVISTQSSSGGDGDSSNVFTFDSTRIEKVQDPNHKWANYILGVVAQYTPDLKQDQILSFDLAIAGDVPLGSGLSSSASLEVSVARFLECVLGKDVAFSSVWKWNEVDRKKAIERALRCRKAENVYADSPCGIMDQYVSSAGKKDCALMIDCRSLDYQEVHMGGGGGQQGQGKDTEEEEELDKPAVVICNSHVSHSIANGEYPIRVSQCQTATTILQQHFSDSATKIESLRDATLDHLAQCQNRLDEVTYKRAKHVITENERVVQAVAALQGGDWKQMGGLMNASHDSLRDDFEVSCKEVDALVALARSYISGGGVDEDGCRGVYGSRITGGGFGGCTVTLVPRKHVDGLICFLKEGYRRQLGLECSCFVTDAGDGSRVIQL